MATFEEQHQQTNPLLAAPPMAERLADDPWVNPSGTNPIDTQSPPPVMEAFLYTPVDRSPRRYALRNKVGSIAGNLAVVGGAFAVLTAGCAQEAGITTAGGGSAQAQEAPETTVQPEEQIGTAESIPQQEATIPMLEGHSIHPESTSLFIDPLDREFPPPSAELADMIVDDPVLQDPQILMERTLQNLEFIVNSDNYQFAYEYMFPFGEVDQTWLNIAEDHVNRRNVAGFYYRYYLGKLIDHDFENANGSRKLLFEFFTYDSQNQQTQQINYLVTLRAKDDHWGIEYIEYVDLEPGETELTIPE